MENLLTIVLASLSFFLVLIIWALSLIKGAKPFAVRKPVKKRPTADEDEATSRQPLRMGAEEPPPSANNVMDEDLVQIPIEQQLRDIAERMGGGVTESQVRAYWNSFTKYDVDGGGSISLDELSNMMVDTIGYKPSDEDLARFMRDADEDGSGSIEFHEFVMLVSKLDMGEQTKEDIEEAFYLWAGNDEAGRPMKYISGDKIRHALVKLGDKMSEEEAEEFMRMADVDGNGSIELNEFVRAMAWREKPEEIVEEEVEEEVQA